MATLKSVIFVLALSGCVQQGVPVKEVLHVLECGQWRAIYLPKEMPEPPPAWAERWIDETLIHNEYGEMRKCW
jgi:hypothetical protein